MSRRVKPDRLNAILQAIALKPLNETFEQLAQRIGVSVRTIHRYRDEYPEQILAIAQAEFRKEIPAVKRALAKAAKEGDVAAIKLFCEMTGEYTPRSESKTETMHRFVEMRQLTNAEIEQLIAEMLNKQGVTLPTESS